MCWILRRFEGVEPTVSDNSKTPPRSDKGAITQHFGPLTENDARTRTGNPRMHDNPLPAALKSDSRARSGKGDELALFHCSIQLSYIVRLSKFPVGKGRTGKLLAERGGTRTRYLQFAKLKLYHLSYAITQNYGPPDCGRATLKKENPLSSARRAGMLRRGH